MRPGAHIAAAAIAAVSLTAGGCSSSEAAFCEELGQFAELDALQAALEAGDEDATYAQLNALDALAENAPEQIRGDLTEISDVMAEVVVVALQDPSDAATSEGEQERERVNQRLSRVVGHTTAVSDWTEENCGIRLN